MKPTNYERPRTMPGPGGTYVHAVDLIRFARTEASDRAKRARDDGGAVDAIRESQNWEALLAWLSAVVEHARDVQIDETKPAALPSASPPKKGELQVGPKGMSYQSFNPTSPNWPIAMLVDRGVFFSVARDPHTGRLYLAADTLLQAISAWIERFLPERAGEFPETLAAMQEGAKGVAIMIDRIEREAKSLL